MSLKVYPTALFKDRDIEHFSNCGYTTHTFWKNSIEKYGNVEVVDIQECDVICLFVTCLGNSYIFDLDKSELIKKYNKPVVIFDFSEYGGHETTPLSQYNLYGYKIEHVGLLEGDYVHLHAFLIEIQSLIKCYFKRELSIINDLTAIPFKLFPLEFIADEYTFNGIPDTRDEYYSRQCLMNFIWGYSNLSRPHLHGGILQSMELFRSHFALSFRQAIEYLKGSDKFILLVNHDWYERVDCKSLIDMQKKSRMVIDLYGCGLKCFRNVEATNNCLSVKQDPTKLIFTYPWIDGVNCICVPTLNNSNLVDVDSAVKILLTYRHEKQNLLYDLYLNSLETNSKYSPKNYVPNHVIKNIEMVF